MRLYYLFALITASRSAASQLQTPIDSQQWDVVGDLTRTLQVLQGTWYDLSRGTWPSSIDWTAAVLNTHVAATLDVLSRSNASDNELNRFFAHTAAYYFGENHNALKGEAYDDRLWVVLGWLESIAFIKSHASRKNDHFHAQQHIDAFSRRAATFYDLTNDGWTDLCDGGMTWDPKFEPYKNSITNQLYIAASVAMYRRLPGEMTDGTRQRLLDNAERGYAWLKEANLTNDRGLYVDGFHIAGWQRNITNPPCWHHNRNEMVYTYNQGVLLSGLRDLWEATQNRLYLTDGHALISNTINATGWNMTSNLPINTHLWQGIGRKGILEDFCDSSATCNQDAHTFKSTYFHHFTAFCDNATGEHRKQCLRYKPWIEHNARAAMASRDEQGRVGAWWGIAGTVEPSSLPSGATDYRNNPDLVPRKHTLAQPSKQHTRRAQKSSEQEISGDWNDRGRGRTVESHAGGVAVLRCLWTLQQLEQ